MLETILLLYLFHLFVPWVRIPPRLVALFYLYGVGEKDDTSTADY